MFGIYPRIMEEQRKICGECQVSKKKKRTREKKIRIEREKTEKKRRDAEGSEAMRRTPRGSEKRKEAQRTGK